MHGNKKTSKTSASEALTSNTECKSYSGGPQASHRPCRIASISCAQQELPVLPVLSMHMANRRARTMPDLTFMVSINGLK